MENNSTSSNLSRDPSENKNVNELDTSSEPSSTSPTTEHTVEMSKKVKSIKKIIITIIILGLAIIAGLAYWIMQQETKQSASSSDELSNTSTEAEPKSAKYALLFTKSTDIAEGDCMYTNHELYHRLFEDAESTDVNIAQGTITNMAIKDEHVVLVKEKGCQSSVGPVVYHSSDGGKTFEEIFTGEAGSDGAFGDQITSLAIASDKTSALIGVLPHDDGNTVKQIDFETKEMTDVFSTDMRGVFLHGFDATNNEVYYSEGCYNCDGNTRSELLSFDVTKKLRSVVYSLGDNEIGTVIVVNEAMTKAMVANGVSGDGLGAGPPYMVREVSLTDGSDTVLMRDQDAFLTPGYRTGDSLPFVVNATKVLGLSGQNIITLFEANDTISSPLHVSKELISVVNGESANAIIVFNVEENEASQLTTMSDFQQALGVTKVE